MATVVAVAIVITWIVGGAIISASVVVIPIPGIAVAAIVIARPVISRCHTHAELARTFLRPPTPMRSLSCGTCSLPALSAGAWI